MKSLVDPAGTRLPIKLDSTSNGEFVPVPLSPANREANRLAHAAAQRNAKRLDISKREFLISACGAASTLLSFNAANAAAGKTGGFFDLPVAAALEPQAARSVADQGEFIFDVQGHFIDTPKGNSKGPEVFINDVFLDSDTDMMVLSFVPSARDAEPVTIQAADSVRRVVEKLEGTHRLLIHGPVNPNQAGDLERMARGGSTPRPTQRVPCQRATLCCSSCASGWTRGGRQTTRSSTPRRTRWGVA